MIDHSAPKFSQPESEDLWNSYFSRIDKLAKPLARPQRRDILLEISAHLLEGILEGSGSESERLRTAQQRLGEPEEFVPGWVEERLAQSADPGLVMHSRWQLLRLSALSGVRGLLKSMLHGFGHMLVFYSYLLAILKPFFPDNVGLYTTPKGYPFIGFVDAAEFTEHLGWWFIPVVLIIGTSILWLLNHRTAK